MCRVWQFGGIDMRVAVVPEEDVKALSLKANGVLIELPGNVSAELWASLREAIDKAVKLLGEKLIIDADRMAQVLVGMAVPSVDLVRERVARYQTMLVLTQQTEWLTATDIQSATDGHARMVADWKRRKRIFGVAGPDGKDLFPAYQFDAAMRPLPVIATVLKAFGPVADPWTLVAWFHFPNGWLVREQDPEHKPQAPKDFLDDEPALARAASLHGNSYVA
jgi:hypothetical protein